MRHEEVISNTCPKSYSWWVEELGFKPGADPGRFPKGARFHLSLKDLHRLARARHAGRTENFLVEKISMSRYTGMKKQDAQGIGESHRHNIEDRKPDTKGYILYHSIWCRNRQHYGKRNHNSSYFQGLMTKRGHKRDFWGASNLYLHL